MKNKIKQFIKLKIAKKKCIKNDKDYKQLESLVSKADVVSFDMFDTLVTRNVQKPDHIFQIVAEDAKKVFKFTFDFPEIRKSAEVDVYNKQGEKISIQDIYQRVEELGISNEICNWLMKRELEIEKKFIVRDELGKTLYDICKQKNKKIIVTSDMYLSKDFFSKKLVSLGYQVDEIFISGECGCSKDKGELYELLKNKLGTNNILHIGDNFHADFTQARKHGLEGYWVVRNKKMN